MEKHTELTAGLRLGDTKALKGFYELFEAPLSYYAFKLLHQEQDVRGVVNTSFQKLWERRAFFDADSNIQAFLYTTVRNHCYDLLRAQKRSHLEFPEDIPYEGIQPALDIHYRANSQLFQMIFDEIDRLSTLQRNVLQLHYLQGKTIQEIAELLNTTSNNISNAKRKGLDNLRKHFESHYPSVDFKDLLLPLLILSLASLPASS